MVQIIAGRKGKGKTKHLLEKANTAVKDAHGTIVSVSYTHLERTGQFFKGTLYRGDSLESEASIVIIGDVEHGARVTAKGNIVILGELKGSAFAGASGDENTVIVALDMICLLYTSSLLVYRFL